MATFIVDRVVPGLTTELLLEAQRLLHEAARRVSKGTDTVRYLRCTFMAEEHRCICLFEAPSAAMVKTVNDIAQVPFRRIQPATEFTEPGTTTYPVGAPTEGRDR